MSRFVSDLAVRVLTFDESEQLAHAVARLMPSEVADAYDAPARGNQLTVYSRGIAGTAPHDGAPVSSIDAFRASTSSRTAAGQR